MVNDTRLSHHVRHIILNVARFSKHLPYHSQYNKVWLFLLGMISFIMCVCIYTHTHTHTQTFFPLVSRNSAFRLDSPFPLLLVSENIRLYLNRKGKISRGTYMYIFVKYQ